MVNITSDVSVSTCKSTEQRHNREQRENSGDSDICFFFAVPRIISAAIGFLGKHAALTNVNVQHYPTSCPNKVFKQTTGWILCVLMAGLAHKHPLLTTLTHTYHAIIIAKACLNVRAQRVICYKSCAVTIAVRHLCVCVSVSLLGCLFRSRLSLFQTHTQT